MSHFMISMVPDQENNIRRESKHEESHKMTIIKRLSNNSFNDAKRRRQTYGHGAKLRGCS